MDVDIIQDGITPSIHQDKAISVITQTLSSEGFTDGEISIVFSDDESLRKLKQEFFKKDEFTDVIAFRLNDYAEQKVEGEIYISLERAEENAKKFEEAFEKEICRLIIHGGLHLLNYDDAAQEERIIMRDKENLYLKSCGWEGILDE